MKSLMKKKKLFFITDLHPITINIKKETISQINRKYFFSFFEFNPHVKEVPKNDYEHLNLENLKKIVSNNHDSYWKKVIYEFIILL